MRGQGTGRLLVWHLSPGTVQAYVAWIGRHIRYHDTRHPGELGEREVVACPTCLTSERRVSWFAQWQALSAQLVRACGVFGIPFTHLKRVPRCRNLRHLPAVPSREEVVSVVAQLEGTKSDNCKALIRGCGWRSV